MARFAFLLFSLFLFALNPASANWHTDGAQISSPPKGYQVAQGGARCASYAKAKNCKAQWDRRTKECVCVGWNGVINISLRRNKTELRFADEQQVDCNRSAIMF